MIIPMRCFTCNEPLANLWEHYQREVKKQDAALPAHKAGDAGETPQPLPKYKKQILDKLELDNMCCRRHLLGHVDLIDII